MSSILSDELIDVIPSLEDEDVSKTVLYYRIVCPNGVCFYVAAVAEGRDEFYGFATGFEQKGLWGYFWLSELEKAQGSKWKTKRIRLDPEFKPTKFGELKLDT